MLIINTPADPVKRSCLRERPEYGRSVFVRDCVDLRFRWQDQTRGWERPCRRYLTQFLKIALEPGRRDEGKELRDRRIDLERVRDADWDVAEGAGSRVKSQVTDDHRKITFDHVEPFGLAAVRVQRRLIAACTELLDQLIAACGL